MKSTADLLAELNAAVVDGSPGRKTTAASLRQFLTSIIEQLAETEVAASLLPVPRLQARRLMLNAVNANDTRNFVRVLFDHALPADVLARNPEIWLFTHNTRRRRRSPVRKSSWGHPSHLDGLRHRSAFFGGGTVYNTATEFFGPAIATSLAEARPFADILIEGADWFAGTTFPLRARGKKGVVRRFRFALVVDAPQAPSGKLIGPLSDEIWLRSDSSDPVFYFHAPVYNRG